MRIALLNGSTLYPLAGQAGVSERVHSGAANVRISPDIQVQESNRVRAANRAHFDRKNLATRITFTTTRVFATATAADLWAMDYDAAYPREGTLVLDHTDFLYPSAIVITALGETPLTSDGSTPVVFGTLPYIGMANGRPNYDDGDELSGGSCGWDPETEAWILSKREDGDQGATWTGAEDVASPEMVTAWVAQSPATGTPVITQVWDDPDRRYLLNAIVRPPERSIIGCTVELSYAVVGGAFASTIPS